jgi:hypothetical protein
MNKEDRDLTTDMEVSTARHSSIQKAGGPRSRAGKRQSSRNAIKHGVFSEVLVLPGESGKEYRSLIRNLCETLQPEGGLEKLLVEKLAALAWRYRRLLIAEGAETRHGADFWEWDKQNRERKESANRACTVDIEHLLEPDPGMISRIEDPETLTGCLELLRDLRQEIESCGLDSERNEAVMQKIYGPPTEAGKTLFNTYLVWLETSSASEEERTRERYATPEECKDNILSAIDKEIQRLRKYQRRHASVESQRAELEALRRTIPESERLDRLLRYEASLERAFDRTLSQLERVQRLRRGQWVAPRVEVDVNS